MDTTFPHPFSSRRARTLLFNACTLRQTEEEADRPHLALASVPTPSSDGRRAVRFRMVTENRCSIVKVYHIPRKRTSRYASQSWPSLCNDMPKKHLLFPKEPYPISSLWSGFIPSSSGYEFRIHLCGFFADNLILFEGLVRHYVGERLISHGILVNVTAKIGHKSRHEVPRILYICSGDYWQIWRSTRAHRQTERTTGNTQRESGPPRRGTQDRRAYHPA